MSFLPSLLGLAARLSLLSSLVLCKMTPASYFYRDDRPLVISHRGAFGSFPEHSIGAYVQAYYDGADFIELDVQVTRDGQLVAQHDDFLDDSTDVRDH